MIADEFKKYMKQYIGCTIEGDELDFEFTPEEIFSMAEEEAIEKVVVNEVTIFYFEDGSSFIM